jgi:hypothetical protein
MGYTVFFFFQTALGSSGCSMSACQATCAIVHPLQLMLPCNYQLAVGNVNSICVRGSVCYFTIVGSLKAIISNIGGVKPKKCLQNNLNV